MTLSRRDRSSDRRVRIRLGNSVKTNVEEVEDGDIHNRQEVIYISVEK